MEGDRRVSPSSRSGRKKRQSRRISTIISSILLLTSLTLLLDFVLLVGDNDEDEGRTLSTASNNCTLDDDSRRCQQGDDAQPQLVPWLKDYIEWHHQARRDMFFASSSSTTTTPLDADRQDDEASAEDGRTRPVRVLWITQVPDGLSDRLRSLPYFAWLAAHTQRLLLISWTTPCRLEEYLLPHDHHHSSSFHSINWTLPLESSTWSSITSDGDGRVIDVLQHLGFGTDHFVTRTDVQSLQDIPILTMYEKTQFFFQGTPWVIQQSLSSSVATISDDDHHTLPYSNNDSPIADGNSGRVILRQVFDTLFQLSPAVQALYDEMKRQIVTDEYYGIHLRTRYPNVAGVTAHKRFRDKVKLDQIGWNPNAMSADDEANLRQLARHALDCCCFRNHTLATAAKSEAPATTVYVASDTAIVVDYMKDMITSSSGLRIVSLPSNLDRLHLKNPAPPKTSTTTTKKIDATNNNDDSNNMQCRSFDPAFVDLWILRDATLGLSIGVGGFGLLASLLSPPLTTTITSATDGNYHKHFPPIFHQQPTISNEETKSPAFMALLRKTIKVRNDRDENQSEVEDHDELRLCLS